MKSHFTYIINGEINNKNHDYISNSPKNASKKIINRYLRNKNNEIIELNLTVINLVSNKKYYYKVICYKNEIPIYKRISEFKTIELKYNIFIQNVSRDLVEFLKK